MKILYIVHQFYPEFYSGTEKVIFNIAKMMQIYGHKVKVFTYSFYDNSFYDYIIGSVMLKEYLYEGIPVLAIKLTNPSFDLHYALANDELGIVTDELIGKEQPDIVHIGHSMRLSEFIKAAKRIKIPYLLTVTDFFLLCPKVVLSDISGNLCAGPNGGKTCKKNCPELPRNMISERLQHASDIIKNAEKIISPSNFVASIFCNSISGLEVKVIKHGISYSYITSNERKYKDGDDICFGYAGSLEYHKGIHTLIKAFKDIQNENIRLKIYGSGSDEKYVNEIKLMSNTDDRISFCGIYTKEETGKILSDIDVIVIPSLCYESYSLILHEAIACNVPAIVSNAGGLAEVANNKIGFTFELGDSDGLNKVMNEIIDNTSKLNDIKNMISNIIVPTIEQEAYAYEREYYSILNG